MNSTTRKPAEDGGARGPMTRISTYLTMHSNPFRVSERAPMPEQRAKFLDDAMIFAAKELQAKVHHSRRSKFESDFLRDCARGRRPFNRENALLLMAIQDRDDATVHLLSDQLHAVESATAASIEPECLVEVGLAIEEADVALDRARTLYAKEQTPVRASVMWECLCQLARQVDRGLVQAARVMRRSPNREAVRA